MDKLAPVIKYRFWILLGLALPLIIFGYMSASGAIKTATEERESALDSVLSGVPGGQLPNESYREGLSGINEDLELEVALAHYRILEKQQQGMDWPASLADYLPDTYRGEFPRAAGFIYVDAYEDLLRDAYQIVEPITAEGSGHTGKVSVAYEVLPRHEFRADELSVSSERMWDAMEDIWFLRLLLQAVRTTNGSAGNIAKAPIRMISQLDLMGGDGQTGGSTTAGGEYAGEDEMDYGMMMEIEMDRGGMDAGIGGSSFGAASSVAFDPAEEFGNNVEAVTAQGGEDGATMQPRGARREVRYIELDESKPYRERGFYMSLLINQQQIAEFLINLSNSDWPIRIVRFQVGPNPHNGRTTAGGGYAYGGGGDYEMEMEMGGLGFDEGAIELGGYDSGYGASPYGPQQNLVNDAALAGAFTHPDLVQLEVLGAITFFNPLPEDVLAKVTAALEGTPATTTPETPSTGTDDTLPEPPAAEPEEVSDPAETPTEPEPEPAAADSGADPAETTEPSP